MATPQETRGTILVVENDRSICESLVEILLLSGYHVDGCADGTEALELLRRAPRPDLILLDLMMPGMNGWSFREYQRQDPALASIPIVLISAADDLARHAAALGAAAYLPKPIDLEDLLTTIARYCG
jgi:CheY-like chemotaxis protein